VFLNRPYRLLLLALLTGPGSAWAVILFGTEDPSAHTTAPAGELAGSGWDWQIGPSGGGTVVGPSHVLTAAHLGIGTNSVLTWGGLAFRVLEFTDPPESDLRLLRIGGRFASWAPTFAGSNEIGRSVVLFGRGGPRGFPVTTEKEGLSKLCGWTWRATDQQLRWGTNFIEGIQESTAENPGEFLAALFTDDAGDGEATLSVGDSGGGVFLQEPEGWRLAGVLSGVQGIFKQTPDSGLIYAALFDRRNFLEELSPGVWGYDPDRFDQPGTFWVATRVSTYRDWLQIQLARPSAQPLPRLLYAPTLNGPFEEFPTYSIEASTRRINLLGTSQATVFFQLEGESAVHLVGVTDSVLTLAY